MPDHETDPDSDPDPAPDPRPEPESARQPASQGKPGWTFTEDPLRYVATTLEFLSADPIGNTVTAGVAVRLHLSPRQPQPEDCYGWWTDEDGVIRAAFHAQPPTAVTLSAEVPQQAARELPAAWIASGRPRPAGVFGQVATAEAVAADWARRSGGSFALRPKHAMRLFEFAEPAAPDPAPRGVARVAGLDDLRLAAEWDARFLEDCGLPPSTPEEREPAARAKIEEGRTVIWVVDDVPVALASYSTVVAESSRISGVYTPPEHRRNGYAAGVTWATTYAAIDAGAEHVLLHTDLSNPTSNGVYQRLGYRPLHDVAEFELRD